jgi:hypothetical protein
VLTGAEICAKRKSTPHCLLAIPAFDSIPGLYNRHITLTGEYAYANNFKVSLDFFAKDLCLGGTNLIMGGMNFGWLAVGPD